MMQKLLNKVGVDIGQNLFMPGFGKPFITTYKTWCCSLLQVSLDNESSKEFIIEVIEHLKIQNGRTALRDGGERAVFVITKIPGEEELAETLKEIGFEFIYEFHRRKCYKDEETMLQMWIYSW